jgi:pyruvate ferredoxin oxidoreductase alpha subunit
MKKVIKSGNEAVAEAMRQINPDVVAAYPITPQTEIVMTFSQFVSDGLVKTEYIPVESEHSAMSACIGAAASGARAMTATCSQGLAYMWELLYIASGLRLPIVMAVVARALSAPINIHGDYSDVMGARDSGWIQLYAENVQEAYDFTIMAVKIAEKARLPVMVIMEGFIISHCLEPVELLSDDDVKEFVGEYKPERFLLDVEHPYTLGALDLQDYYFEHKRQVDDAMEKAPDVIKSVMDEFYKKFNRKYYYYEEYKVGGTKKTEVTFVMMGSVAGTTKHVLNNMKEDEIELLKLIVFRPLPVKELFSKLKDSKVVVIFDRASCYNNYSGPLFAEITSLLLGLKSVEKEGNGSVVPVAKNYIYGLGGREVTVEDIKKVICEAKDILRKGYVETGEIRAYIGLRE